jgi:hypothetical protein
VEIRVHIGISGKGGVVSERIEKGNKLRLTRKLSNNWIVHAHVWCSGLRYLCGDETYQLSDDHELVDSRVRRGEVYGRPSTILLVAWCFPQGSIVYAPSHYYIFQTSACHSLTDRKTYLAWSRFEVLVVAEGRNLDQHSIPRASSLTLRAMPWQVLSGQLRC